MANEDGPLGCLFIVLAIVGVGVWGLSESGLVGEQDGVVKYSDCREIIQLPPNTFQKYFHSFQSFHKRQTFLTFCI